MIDLAERTERWCVIRPDPNFNRRFGLPGLNTRMCSFAPLYPISYAGVENELEQLDEFLRTVSSLLDDGGQSLPLEILVVHRDGDTQSRLVRMLEDMMSAFGVMNIKPLRSRARKTLAGRRAGKCGLTLAREWQF